MRRSLTGAYQCCRPVASPREPSVQQAGHAGGVQHLAQPCQLDELVLVAAARPALVTPQQATQMGGHRHTLRAVWAWRLGSYSTFWLAQPAGRCTRVARPSTTTA